MVLQEVPPNCTVVGIPGRIVKREKQNVPQEDLDHGHLPDPVHEDIDTLEMQELELGKRMDSLEKELEELKKALKLTAAKDI